MTVISKSLREAIDLAKSGGDSMVSCPAHDDGQASLHVKRGDKQPVVLFCHAGCTREEILERGGVEEKDIMGDEWGDDGRPVRDILINSSFLTQCAVEPGRVWTPAHPHTASHIYRYTDEDDKLLFEVLRVPLPNGKKSFFQRHPDPTTRSGYAWNMNGVRRVIYRLPEVRQAIQDGRMIWLVEGEKDVETLRALGEVATTSPMGAGKWDDAYTEMLRGANITIVADADATGRTHARSVKEQLDKADCLVRMVEAAEGKDITDHINAGHGLEGVVITSADREEKVTYGVDLLDIVKRVISVEQKWVVPNVLARGDRFLLTGFEGHGKSTLCKQWAVMCAAGLHPWSGMPMPPMKVLYLDAENHPDQSLEDWQMLHELAIKHGRPVQAGMLMVLEEWDSDIDLTTEEGDAYLTERMHAFKPDLLIIGPLYNLAERDLADSVVVGRMKKIINKARALYGSAVLMEHHAPHKSPGDSSRSVRPYGSSTFLKWPEFGYGLKPLGEEGEEMEGVYQFQKFRFNRIRKRYFPANLRWGNQDEDSIEWPWVECIVDSEGIVH